MKKLLLVVLCSLPLVAMEESALEIKGTSLRVPGRLGEISVLHTEEGFRVKQDGNLYEVHNGDVDKEIRHVSNARLKTLLARSYIAVNQSDNGDFSLKAHMRGKGGGPILAGIAYWAVKTICYGTIGAAAATGVAVVGPAIATGAGTAVVAVTGSAAAGSAATAVTGGAVAIGTAYLGGAATATTMGAGMATAGAIGVSGAIATSTTATAAATTATGALMAASGGCIATMTFGIEMLAGGIWAFALGLPTI